MALPLATVTTQAVTDIAGQVALANGSVTALSSFGSDPFIYFLYNTTSFATPPDGLTDPSTYGTVVSTLTTEGIGSFAFPLTNLNYATTYYVCTVGYTDDPGVGGKGYTYGNVVSFTTTATPPAPEYYPTATIFFQGGIANVVAPNGTITIYPAFNTPEVLIVGAALGGSPSVSDNVGNSYQTVNAPAGSLSFFYACDASLPPLGSPLVITVTSGGGPAVSSAAIYSGVKTNHSVAVDQTVFASGSTGIPSVSITPKGGAGELIYAAVAVGSPHYGLFDFESPFETFNTDPGVFVAALNTGSNTESTGQQILNFPNPLVFEEDALGGWVMGAIAFIPYPYPSPMQWGLGY